MICIEKYIKYKEKYLELSGGTHSKCKKSHISAVQKTPTLLPTSIGPVVAPKPLVVPVEFLYKYTKRFNLNYNSKISDLKN